MSSLNLPQPAFQPAFPPSGWWKCPISIFNDPVVYRLEPEIRLSAIGLLNAAIGWALSANCSDGWVPREAMLRGQACPAPEELIKNCLEALNEAGLICATPKDGVEGYVISGAAKAAADREARKQSASDAGKASQAKRAPLFRGQLEADQKVDWSKESGDWSK